MVKKKSGKKEGYSQSILDEKSQRNNKKQRKLSLKELTPSYNKKSVPKTRKGKKRFVFQTMEDECFVPVTSRQIKDIGMIEKREGQVVVEIPVKESMIKKILPMIIGALIVIAAVVVLTLIFIYINS